MSIIGHVGQVVQPPPAASNPTTQFQVGVFRIEMWIIYCFGLLLAFIFTVKLLLYKLVDDQHLKKHFQPWVKSKRSVDDHTLLIGGIYIGKTPASSIFCATFLNKSSLSFSYGDNTTTVSFYFLLMAPGKDLEHAQNANSNKRYDADVHAGRMLTMNDLNVHTVELGGSISTERGFQYVLFKHDFIPVSC